MWDFHNFGLILHDQCFFRMEQPLRGQRSEKIFQKTLILVFEVIVQPPKTHFLTFSNETKIMKITHSAVYVFKIGIEYM